MENEMTIQQIKRWFETAVPEPTPHNASVQYGCHLEEVSEGLLASLDSIDAEMVSQLAHDYKHGMELAIADREEMLDALCDQIVTAIGVAHMLGMDIEGALQEVARSNDSKFVDGHPIFNESGKIMKGPNYTKPDLSGFV